MAQVLTAAEMVGQRVRRLRRENGLSAADVEKRSGGRIKRQVIANLELGRREQVTVPEVFALAAALDVPPLFLLLPDDETRLQATEDIELDSAQLVLWTIGKATLGNSLPTGGFSRASSQLVLFLDAADAIEEAKNADRAGRDEDLDQVLQRLARLIAPMTAMGVTLPRMPLKFADLMVDRGWADRGWFGQSATGAGD
jgi:transcriptional regulator with XRE-family HTH domain